MGPGLLVKAVMQGYFSLIIFGWAQVLMDIQPLLAIMTGKGRVHGFSHTYIGAVLIAVIAVVTGKWIYHWCMRLMEKDFSPYQKQLFNIPARLNVAISISSALIGTLSHVLLDSVMHPDVEPFFPLDTQNHLAFVLSIGALYRLCVYSAAVGVIVYFCVRLLQMKLTSVVRRS
jgi:hypothetical protein